LRNLRFRLCAEVYGIIHVDMNAVDATFCLSGRGVLSDAEKKGHTAGTPSLLCWWDFASAPILHFYPVVVVVLSKSRKHSTMRTSWQRSQKTHNQDDANAYRGIKGQARTIIHTLPRSHLPPFPSPVTFACTHHMTFLNLIPFRDRTCFSRADWEIYAAVTTAPTYTSSSHSRESFVLHHTYLET
jgi:hypothetical protein